VNAARIAHARRVLYFLVLKDRATRGTLDAVPTTLRIWRAADRTVFHARMDDRADAALARMLAGEPFAAVCEVFDDLPPSDGAREATALLLRWLEDGIIARAT